MKMKKSGVVLLALLCLFFLFACGGGSSGSSDNGAAGASGPAASGTFTINTSGADGGPDGGSGGNGGYVDIQMYYGSMGPLQVMASGAADASFTPTASTPNLGTDPVNITADKTIPLDPGFPGGDPGAGEPYMLSGDTSLYISDGNGNPADDVTATGLSVAAGATLTLELNNPQTAQVDLENDINNDGTITTVDDSATQRGNLQLDLNSYHGNGTIDTSGTLDGQSGGYVWISPSYSFFNHGTIDTSGADSIADTAGDGGYVQIYAYYVIENTGNITTDGGAGSGAGATGGSAGSLDWEADLSLYNSGNLSCRGGDGVDGGGDGNSIYLFAGYNYPGDLYNSGDLDTSGGDATAGDGGWGNSVDIYAYGGDIINSGNLTTKGGDTTDPDSNGGNSGDYVYLEVYSQSPFTGEPNYDTPPGDVMFSGDVDTSGGLAVTDAGATGDGGSGGYFQIYTDYDYFPLGQQVSLLGYSGIDTSGGDGNYGGTGGYVDLFCDYGETDVIWTAGCNMTNEVDINARGGSVVAAATSIPANGGSGGYVEMETEYDEGGLYPDMDKVVNNGNIDTSGGDSLEVTSSPGSASYVWIWGFNGVTNSGNITAGGGDNLGADGPPLTSYGNDGENVELYAELGPVTNSGDLSTDGGDGEDGGGSAYFIGLFGPEVSNSGVLSASGGDADPSVPGSTGGDGYDVELSSPAGMQGITQTGTVTNDGGTGDDPGSDGDYYLGGQLL